MKNLFIIEAKLGLISPLVHSTSKVTCVLVVVEVTREAQTEGTELFVLGPGSSTSVSE